jgi:ABC-type branched-subunit amino acid transport system substrate-binding protein
VAVAAALTTGVAACSSSSNKSGNSGGSTSSSASNGGNAGAKFAKPSGAVRGFDGSQITLAGLGITAQFPGADVGVKARVKRFNDTNEIPGIKINYTEYANSGQDPATALSEARRLVSSDKAFAIVGDTSQNNPGAYFKQQKVPYFGWAFDNTYCSNSDQPSTDVWGFGWNGCLIPDNPKVMPDAGAQLYTYVKQQTGKDHPTLAMFSNSTQSGKNSVSTQAFAYAGAGFNVVMKSGLLPLPPISDYTPYAQQVLTADNGKAPDAVVCLLSTDCIQMWGLMKAQGYKGTFQSPLYSDLLLKPMQGSVASIQFVALNESNASIDQINTDVKAVAPKQAVDTGVLTGYWTTDEFIQALKTVNKAGKNLITPENVQKAAAVQTWQMPGLVGPVQYPAATLKSTPACTSIVLDNGTEWKTVVPYKCSSKGWPVS